MCEAPEEQRQSNCGLQQHPTPGAVETHLQRLVSCLPVLQSCRLLGQLLKSFLSLCCMCLVGRLKLSEPRHQLVVAAAEHSLQQTATMQGGQHALLSILTPHRQLDCKSILHMLQAFEWLVLQLPQAACTATGCRTAPRMPCTHGQLSMLGASKSAAWSQLTVMLMDLSMLCCSP